MDRREFLKLGVIAGGTILARISHDGIILRAASPGNTITSMMLSTQRIATATEQAI